MGISVEEAIHELRNREEVFVAYSQATRLPYVTCDEETFNDQARIFATEEEIKEVKEQITFMKEYREVLQFGTFYRLKSPFEGNETVWMVTNEDRTLAIVGYYRVLNGVNQPYSRVRLQGLDPDMVYENVWNHTENYGDELMNYGLITSDVTAGEVPGNVTPCTDFESRIYMLKGKKVQEGR